MSQTICSEFHAIPSARFNRPYTHAEWAPPSSAPVLICLLGDFRLIHSDQVLFKRCPKAELILSSLALQPKNTISRELLLDQLWPNTPMRAANALLRNLLFKLRQTLAPLLGGVAPIIRNGDLYQLNVEAGISIDVNEFTANVALGDQAQAKLDRQAAAMHFQKAIELYRGDLLQHTTDGCDPSYEIMMERERLRAMYIRSLEYLANEAIDRQAYLEGIDLSHAILQNDPCYEPAYRLLMVCHTRRQERALAFSIYELCRKALHMICAVEPELATRTLYEQIRLNPDCV